VSRKDFSIFLQTQRRNVMQQVTFGLCHKPDCSYLPTHGHFHTKRGAFPITVFSVSGGMHLARRVERETREFDGLDLLSLEKTMREANLPEVIDPQKLLGLAGYVMNDLREGVDVTTIETLVLDRMFESASVGLGLLLKPRFEVCSESECEIDSAHGHIFKGRRPFPVSIVSVETGRLIIDRIIEAETRLNGPDARSIQDSDIPLLEASMREAGLPERTETAEEDLVFINQEMDAYEASRHSFNERRIQEIASVVTDALIGPDGRPTNKNIAIAKIPGVGIAVIEVSSKPRGVGSDVREISSGISAENLPLGRSFFDAGFSGKGGRRLDN
jgi:hypothetical protein